MRRVGLIAGFGLGAAVLFTALLSILRLTLDLEAAEVEARRHAAREERIRLALWRMDSALSAFLAYENAQPVDRPAATRPTDPAWVGRRFEVAAGAAPPASRAGDEGEASGDRIEAERLLALLGQPPLAAPTATVADEAPAAATGDPIVQEEELQAWRNVVEFSQRQKFAGQQSVLAVEPPEAAAAEPAPARPPRPSASVVEALVPVWDDGRLLLVRRVVRGGVESLQGIEIDTSGLTGWLLAEVRDLLPAGELEPAPAAEVADPGRRLALLPLRLVPGPVAAIEGAGPPAAPSVRVGLGLALAAILVVAAASGMVLLAGLRLARQRTEFASAVVHELRTPLTTFRVYTDLLAEEMVPAEERPDYLATLRREAGRLGHLVENVLAFARLERRAAPDAERIALARWLREVSSALTERTAEAGLELRIEIDPEVEDSAVEADPTALERILHNLCENSCRYGRGEPARVDLRAELHGRRVVVRWRDHGPGIPRRARRRLFRAFQSPAGHDGPSPGVGPGVGLGLALSRRLARRFGGDLRLGEASGPGAAFELVLPEAR